MSAAAERDPSLRGSLMMEVRIEVAGFIRRASRGRTKKDTERARGGEAIGEILEEDASLIGYA